jgi:predicted AlkP superfamily phosphohydrolase/phosphomutase
MGEKKKVLIIGMDGASPRLLFPWARSGELPALRRLMERGIHGTLLSTVPPATYPAWSSFMTGANPGKHGLFDFTARVPGSYSIQFVNSTHRKMPTLWRILSDAGFRVGVMGMPSTYPPEHVNGFMISGFDSPVATGIEGSFVWPRQLYGEIKKNVGEYLITDFQELKIGPDWHDKAIEGLEKTVRRKADIARYLLGKKEVDLLCVLFGESDTVSHHFWSAFDPGSPRFVRQLGERHADGILKVYRWIDAEIGSLLEEFPDDALVLVVSDHGFGGSGDRVLYLNRWLEEKGYLRFKGSGGALVRGLEGLKSRMLDIVPVKLQEQVFRRFGGRVANTLESRLRFGSIEWGKTAAFSEELNYFPSIWVNVEGREPEGRVARGGEYEDLRDELIEELEKWRDPETRERVVRKAWRREDLYWGDHIEEAPDIVLETSLESGYSYNVLPSRSGESTSPVRHLGETELVGSKGRGMNGSHRQEGIFVLAGPGIGAAEGPLTARIWDPMVTVLDFLGVEAPAGLDGTGLLGPRESRRAAGTQAVDGKLPSTPTPLSAKEQDEIAKRLRGLGYLE